MTFALLASLLSTLTSTATADRSPLPGESGCGYQVRMAYAHSDAAEAHEYIPVACGGLYVEPSVRCTVLALDLCKRRDADDLGACVAEVWGDIGDDTLDCGNLVTR